MDKKMIAPLRKVMAEFIQADGYQISLRRPLFSETEAGGWTKGNWTTLSPQTFRLIPFKRRLTDLVREVADGEIPNLAYTLVGMYNCDLKRMDEFFVNGTYFRVMGVEPHTNDRSYTDRVVAQLKMLEKEDVMWDVIP